MRKFKRVLSLILVATMILSLVGCGSEPSIETSVDSTETTAGENSAPSVLKISERSDAVGLNPIKDTSGPDNSVGNMIYECLLRDVADDGDKAVLLPGAAESYEISDDGLVYTFKLREDGKWNDGVPVTAKDFEYTLKTMADPTSGSTAGWLYDGVILNFSESMYEEGKTPDDIGVKSLDDHTLEITLVKPFGYFLELCAGAYPVREDKYIEYGDAYGSGIDKIVCNGPFVIDSWDPKVQMTFKKNENYWNKDNVKSDTIIKKIIEDQGTRAQALLSGEIDILQIGDDDWTKMIEETGDFNCKHAAGNDPQHFVLNCKNEYLKNAKIRQALSISIDREKFNKDLRLGKDEPLYSLMPAVTQIGDELYCDVVNNENQIIKTLQKENPDPKALLIEGLKELGKDPDPAKMNIHLATRGTGEYSKKEAEWLYQQWQEILGITITIDMLEWNIMWDKVDVGDYDIATCGWGPYYNDPNGLLSLYDCEDGYFNSEKTGWTGPDSERFHQLLVDASNSADNKERAKMFLEAEKILVGTGVVSPTFCKTTTTYIRKNVKGYSENPHSYVDYTKIYVE